MFPKSGNRFSKKIMLKQEVTIDTALVSRLVATQFPRWKDLAVRPVASGGWDNRTFHLGDDMLVRLPSAAAYSLQVEKEHRWLPRLAPLLPLPVPVPLAMGTPADNYPWHWSVYRWIEGRNSRPAWPSSWSPCNGSISPADRRQGSTTFFEADH